MKIGNKIKKMRELRNYTQEHMAAKLEMSQNGYSKIERDDTDVPFSRLVQIAKVLEVELVDLIAFDGQKLMFHISTNEGQGVQSVQSYCSQFYSYSEKQTQDLKDSYEGRITDLQKEIERLHALLEKALTN